jgi:hypothetical protein
MDVTQPVWGECPGPVLEKGVVEKKKKKKGKVAEIWTPSAITLQHSGARKQKPRTLDKFKFAGVDSGN